MICLSPSLSFHLRHPGSDAPKTPSSKSRNTSHPSTSTCPVATMNLPSMNTAPAVNAADISKCLGLNLMLPKAGSAHPEIYQHLKVFPWDVSCLNLLDHRRAIFPEVFAGRAATTKHVEYLVELRFLNTALRGWIEVTFGRSPHYIAPLDKGFVLLSIANAYKELPEVLRELAIIREKTYSSSVKTYCDEVGTALKEVYDSPEVAALYETIKKQCTVSTE